MSRIGSPKKLLILGGTGEGIALAEALQAEAGIDVISSLAGRVANPKLPPGQVRIGGFGGPEGLAAYLRDSRIDALVDATHGNRYSLVSEKDEGRNQELQDGFFRQKASYPASILQVHQYEA